ncbi:cytochrome P450 [Leucogyrophana mollusca]|uniref:Cytochrome P450 n=1 Tax=Leucogyrophana mollusca TaxID=85980 RepID=A0ACB8BA29_9AGAM|nr:cytochrome P450 [Leucogyrophana mollusca]
MGIVGSSFLSTSTLSTIPSHGSSGWYVPPWARLRFFYDSKRIIFEGYQKYKSTVYKVQRWSGWVVLVTGETLVEELHRLPDEVLSLEESARIEMQILHTMGDGVCFNPYHLSLLRSKLPRHLDHLTEELLDEVVPAFEDVIGRLCTEEWMEFNVHNNLTKIVARVFNRILVGLPTCEDPHDYNDVSCRFSVSVYVTSLIINLFPVSVQHLIGRVISRLRSFQNRALKCLEPIIEERKQMMRDFGEASWSDKPNDVLSWLMDEATAEEFETKALATRILAINSATSHTSSYTFMQALLNFASRATYQEPLVREAEEALRNYGWTRDCINSLRLLDSFFKESMRVNGLGSMSFPRKALKDFTLSDGTFIQRGTLVSASFGVHFDEAYYEDSQTFEGFRFATGASVRVNNVMTTTSAKYLPFGHGRHAWYDWMFPGRFLVSYALKAIMVHIITNYDIKLGGDGQRKPDFWFGYHCTPNANAT